MSSPTENMGVLREMMVVKNVPNKISYYKKSGKIRDTPVNLDNGFDFDLENCTSLVADLVLGDTKKTKKKTTMTFKKLENQMNLSLKNNDLNLSVVENASISKMMAIICLAVSITLKFIINKAYVSSSIKKKMSI